MAAAAFCFVYAEHILIKLKLYYDWSTQLLKILWRALSQIQICSPLKLSQSINVGRSTYDGNNKNMYSYFHEGKILLGSSM